jgi:crotonobetainyl-CoA:carnitine CoA-transferase CaiB-like acyl-CoA transferase
MQAELGRELLRRPAAEWERVLSAAGVPCGLVREVGEAASLPHLEARGLRLPLQIDGLPDGRRQVDILNAGFTFSHGGPGVTAPPPRLDEHGARIRDWLKDAGSTTEASGGG